MPITIEDPSQFIPEGGQPTEQPQPLQGQAIFEGGPANPLKAFGVGVARGASARTYDPMIRPDEAGWANAGDLVGTLGANILPWFGGPVVGVPAAAGYAGLRNVNEQAAQGRTGSNINWGQAAGQTVLGGATAALPGHFGGSVLKRALVGAGLGAATGAAPTLWNQYSDTGQVDFSDPAVWTGAGLGGALGGAIGASGPMMQQFGQYLKNRHSQGLPSVSDFSTPSVPDGVYRGAGAGTQDIHGPYVNIHGPAVQEPAPLPQNSPSLRLGTGETQPKALLPSQSSAGMPVQEPFPESPLENLLRGRVELQQALGSADLSGPPSTPYADEVGAQLAQRDQMTQQQLAEWQQRVLAEAQGMRQQQDAAKAAQQQSILDFGQNAVQGAQEIKANKAAQQQAQQQAILDYSQNALQGAREIKSNQAAQQQNQQQAILDFSQNAVGAAQEMRNNQALQASAHQQGVADFTQKALNAAQELRVNQDAQAAAQQQAIIEFTQKAAQEAAILARQNNLNEQQTQQLIVEFTQNALQQAQGLRQSHEVAAQSQQQAIADYANRALGIASEARYPNASQNIELRDTSHAIEGYQIAEKARQIAQQNGLNPQQTEEFVSTMLRNFIGRGQEGGAPANPKLNPATGKPIPKGAQPGFMRLGGQDGESVPVANAISARTLHQVKRYFKDTTEGAVVLMRGMRDAATTLGPEAETKLADMTLAKNAILSKYVNPLNRALSEIGYNPATPDTALENKIDTVFRTATLKDIRDGRVNLQSFGIDPKYNDVIRFMANGLSDDQGLPSLVGFKGLEKYHFKEGYSRSQNPEVFNATVKSQVVDTPKEYKNGSIFYHRENQEGGIGERSVFTRYASHVDRMANQAVAAPIQPNGKGGYEIIPGSPYEYFKKIADSKTATPAEKNAAQLVVDNILNRFYKNDTEKTMKSLQANYVEGILNNRISAGIKNYPSLFALSEVDPATLLTAGVDVISDPQAIRIVDKYGPTTFKNLELMKSGVLSPHFSNRGLDTREIFEAHSRAMTFYGRIKQLAKQRNVSLDEVEAGKTDAAREILRSGMLEIKRTQGNWSSFAGRPTAKPTLGALSLMFKQQKLTELGQLWQMAKTKDWKRFSRYVGTKWLIGGPSNVMDPQTANILLTQIPNMPAPIQQFLDDARQGKGGAMGYAQDLMGEASNLSFRSMIATPTISMSDIPGLGDAANTADWMRHNGAVLSDPNADPMEKAYVLSDAASRSLSLAPSFNAGGLRVSPNLAGRVAGGVLRSLQPDETYRGNRLEIQPGSEIARIVFPGNADKDRLRNYNDDAGRMNQDYRTWFQNQSDKGVGDSVKAQVNRFVSNYKDVLSRRYGTTDAKQLEDTVWNNLYHRTTDDEGNLAPTTKEWGHLTRLMEDWYLAKNTNNREKTSQLYDRYAQERNDLMQRYPGLTEDRILEHYDSGHQTE